jgi:hypothetical protein
VNLAAYEYINKKKKKIDERKKKEKKEKKSFLNIFFCFGSVYLSQWRTLSRANDDKG